MKDDEIRRLELEIGNAHRCVRATTCVYEKLTPPIEFLQNVTKVALQFIFCDFLRESLGQNFIEPSYQICINKVSGWVS